MTKHMVVEQIAPLACPPVVRLSPSAERNWVRGAVQVLEREARRSADTHLLNPSFPALKGISIYLKDETTHPTGSLKHRLARSLFFYALCSGSIRPGTTLVEASSGSTAVSEAYFARLIGLPFIAVMPRSTSIEKIHAIERFGGKCHFVQSPGEVYDVAQRLADRLGGHYLDQFTNAERATDWRGDGSIAHSMFEQMSTEPHPVPAWIVMSAGTGGTASTIGRYIRYRNLATRLCVVDVEHSSFHEAYLSGSQHVICDRPSRIEGVGRPRVEPSFIPGVVDHMIKIPDSASIAAMYTLSDRISRRVGGSTGTNFFGVCWVAASLIASGAQGSIVSLICDGGDRYGATYYNQEWLETNDLHIEPYRRTLETFLDTGVYDPVA